METEAQSHIGGHITLFFTVEKEGRLLRNQGSRGVGLNIDHGVIASVKQVSSDGQISDSTITIIDHEGELLVDSEQQYRQLIDELVYARLLKESYTYNIENYFAITNKSRNGHVSSRINCSCHSF